MPKPNKSFLGPWEYTMVAGEPIAPDGSKAGLLMWQGYGFPDVFYDTTPTYNADDSSGAWFLPMNFWERQNKESSEDEEEKPKKKGDDSDRFRFTAMLYGAVIWGLLPIFTDDLIHYSDKIKMVFSENVYIPHYKLDDISAKQYIDELRNLTSKLVRDCNEHGLEDVQKLIHKLQQLRGTGDNEKQVRLCLLSFSFRRWNEGPKRQQIHPAIIMPSSKVEWWKRAKKAEIDLPLSDGEEN
jgi:hypothetical protein